MHKMPLEGFARGSRKESLERLESSHVHISPTKMRIKLGVQETRSQGDMVTGDTGDETSYLELLDSEPCLDVLGTRPMRLWSPDPIVPRLGLRLQE